FTLHTLSVALFVVFLFSLRAHPDLPSFPTRRSSDLSEDRVDPSRDVEVVDVVQLRLRGPQARAAQRLVHLLRGVRQERREQRVRSEEHTSELQSRENLVCRLLLEKKKQSLVLL